MLLSIAPCWKFLLTKFIIECLLYLKKNWLVFFIQTLYYIYWRIMYAFLIMRNRVLDTLVKPEIAFYTVACLLTMLSHCYRQGWSWDCYVSTRVISVWHDLRNGTLLHFPFTRKKVRNCIESFSQNKYRKCTIWTAASLCPWHCWCPWATMTNYRQVGRMFVGLQW